MKELNRVVRVCGFIILLAVITTAVILFGIPESVTALGNYLRDNILIAGISGIACAVLIAGTVAFWLRYIRYGRDISKRTNFCSLHAGSHIKSDGYIISQDALLAYGGIKSFLSADFDEALDLLNRAAKMCVDPPNRAFCYAWIAKCYEVIDKSAETRQSLEEALRSAPKESALLTKLASLYMADGQHKKAEYLYNTLLENDENPLARCGLGDIHAARGEYDRAIAQYERALTHIKDMPLTLDNNDDNAGAEFNVDYGADDGIDCGNSIFDVDGDDNYGGGIYEFDEEFKLIGGTKTRAAAEANRQSKSTNQSIKTNASVTPKTASEETTRADIRKRQISEFVTEATCYVQQKLALLHIMKGDIKAGQQYRDKLKDGGDAKDEFAQLFSAMLRHAPKQTATQ